MELFIMLFNKIINFLKYPIAFIFAFLTIKLLKLLFEMVINFYNHSTNYQNFFIGMTIYWVLWIIIFNQKRDNWFLTIEHELTHTLFALLTFHKIIDFKATGNRGGYMRFSGIGGGNWLITIAPYFFPTFSMVVIAFIYISESKFYPILTLILGYSTLYHIHSTYQEITLQQPDIQEVGLIFSFLFLPSANLFALIGILSAIPSDNIEFTTIIKNIYEYVLYHFFTFF